MLLINNEIDLGKSFERLIEGITESEKKRKEGEGYSYAEAYGMLKSYVGLHIYQCTGENMYKPNVPAANADDLKEINI